jgi:hypothetical protein
MIPQHNHPFPLPQKTKWTKLRMISNPSQCVNKLLRLYRALVESEITVIVGGLDWEMWEGGKVWEAEDIADNFFTAVASWGCRVVLSICFF